MRTSAYTCAAEVASSSATSGTVRKRRGPFTEVLRSCEPPEAVNGRAPPSLESVADAEAVEARVLADTMQGAPCERGGRDGAQPGIGGAQGKPARGRPSEADPPAGMARMLTVSA